MGKFLESGENDLELQILLITRALEQKQASKMKCRRSRRSENLKINKKLWLNNMVEKTFHSMAEFKLFLEKRNATKTLDIMVDNIKKEVKERKVVWNFNGIFYLFISKAGKNQKTPEDPDFGTWYYLTFLYKEVPGNAANKFFKHF